LTPAETISLPDQFLEEESTEARNNAEESNIPKSWSLQEKYNEREKGKCKRHIHYIRNPRIYR
jgi:hypothetical protein